MPYRLQLLLGHRRHDRAADLPEVRAAGARAAAVALRDSEAGTRESEGESAEEDLVGGLDESRLERAAEMMASEFERKRQESAAAPLSSCQCAGKLANRLLASTWAEARAAGVSFAA